MPYYHTIHTVRETLTRVFAAVESYFDLPADLRAHTPADGGWSIDEILEHITLTNHFLMIVIRNGQAKALKRAQTQPIPGEETDLTPILRIGDPDAFPWVRPEHMEPTRAKPIHEVRQLMRDQGAECLALLNSMPNGEGALHRVRMSVQDLGKLDMYGWLYFLAQHAYRHTIEMDRIHHEYEQN